MGDVRGSSIDSESELERNLPSFEAMEASADEFLSSEESEVDWSLMVSELVREGFWRLYDPPRKKSLPLC